MAGTFATLMLCPLATLAQLGLALAFGVLLDTFVVRTVLVPTFLLLIDRTRPPRAEPPPLLLPRPGELRKSA
jgi:RND superfamily putative drug exporter